MPANVSAPRRATLRVSPDLDDLCRVRDALSAALASCGWSAEDAFRVLLCADEAFANARDHGTEADGKVDIRFHVENDHARIIVGDGALRRIPAIPEIPDATSEHGRGLILMDALADAYRSWRRPIGTFVAMHFTPTRAAA